MAAIGLYAWFVRKDSASKSDSDEKFIQLEKELIDMQTRLVKLEVEMKNMPTEATVRELIGRFESLAAHNEGTVKQLDVPQVNVNRIHDFLLENR